MIGVHAFLVAWWRDPLTEITAAVLGLSLLLWVGLPARRRRIRNTVIVFLLCLLAEMVGVGLETAAYPRAARVLSETLILLEGFIVIRLAGMTLFRLVLERLGMVSPRIVEDLVVILGYILWVLARLSAGGVNLTGLLATSAVFTAVIGFAMQDTLGNILAGLALQFDSSLRLGDWIKVDDQSGQVTQIKWRYTSIRTRNGETVIIPNSHLMKGKYVLITDPELGGVRWRRWVWFSVDYSVPAADVARLAEASIAEADLANVAKAPPPNCVVMDFGPGFVRYALRYWLTDALQDDPTDSVVRRHVLATLQRHGLRVALPDQVVHLVQEGDKHRRRVLERERLRRLKALENVPLFAPLTPEERAQVADGLVYAPFAAGDAMTRQGAVAHWLYIVISGTAEGWYQPERGGPILIETVEAGQVFGELGLMTGVPRANTVLAKTDVEAYRLDKSTFETILHERPELAEALTPRLLARQQQLDALRAAAHVEEPAPQRHPSDMLERVKAFFSLQGPADDQPADPTQPPGNSNSR